MRKYIELALWAVAGCLVFGLIFTAVAHMRERENREACQNNVKQISLATIKTAEDANGSFPLATMPHPTEPPNRRLSWMLKACWNMYCDSVRVNDFDIHKPWDSETNLPLSQHPIQSFICRGAPERSSGYMTHYVGISGVGQNAAFLPLDDPRCGAFGHERRAQYPRDFSDGLAQTILIIETADRNGPWAAGDVPTLRYFDPGVTVQIGRDAPFGRSHGGSTIIATVGFADGSVRSVPATIDSRILAATVTIAGGDRLDNEW
jgi:prepilin-type processing-associated H-X9-DG protein